MGIKRREILKVGTLGAGLMAVSNESMGHNENDQYDTDVLIVGAGNAGIPAAIEASDLGARVMVIEKNSFLGGMLIVSGGHISGANAKIQMKKGIEDSFEKHYQDAMRIGKYKANSELLSVATQNAASMVDWLEEIGVDFTDDSPILEDDHNHYSVARTYVAKDLGRSLLKPLNKEINKRIKEKRIEIRYKTEALKLIEDKNKRIIGVLSKNPSNGTEVIKARSVIIATGGYGANQEMKKAHNPKSLSAKVWCLPHATGDGINMAKEFDAKLVNMDHLVVFPGTINSLNGLPLEINTRLKFAPRHLTESIWVNNKGERFVNEHADPDQREISFSEQEELKFFVIFNQSILENESDTDVLKWNKKTLKDQINKGTTVASAESISELAETINVPKNSMRQTIEEYNLSINNKSDDLFGRLKKRVAIENGPFYAISVGGSLLTTHGGISINHNMEVINNKNHSIKGLYAVGEVTGNGQLMGKGVVSGMSVGPAITFGRLAAREAYRYAQCLCKDEGVKTYDET
jgi:fumarate reductase flavoprotein subunit